MKKIAFIFLLSLATVQGREFAVGIGGGFEAGNGLRLGYKEGRHAGELGLGLLYEAQAAEFQYSVGLRYLRTLYEGRINDTYAWTGAGVLGHDREGSGGYVASAGLGLGISLHFGLPFRLKVDSGWRTFYDGNGSYQEVQYGPTINGALVYEW
jgi:hypothetical protein